MEVQSSQVMKNLIDDILEHHGVDGQKWGVKHGPPYPLDRNAKRQARKAERAEAAKKKKRAKALKKARKTKQKNQEAKRKEEGAKKKAEERAVKERNKRETLYKRASPAKLYRNRQIIANKAEIQDVLDRFDWEQKIQQYSATRLENTAKKAASLIKLMGSGVGGYNIIAGVYNSWFPDEKPLPHINTGKPDNKDNKNNKGKGS